MKRPNIIRAVFEPGMDCSINSMVLRVIYGTMGVKYQKESDSFTNGAVWGIAIDDRHDEGDEPDPHYQLEVGEGDYANQNECKAYCIRYCDYHSTEDGEIVTNPGRWTIRVWIPKDFHFDAYMVAALVNTAYEGTMIAVLPDYEILTSELKPVD